MDERIPFDVRPTRRLMARIDEWRRVQPDLPNKSEAARRLIELALDAAGIPQPEDEAGEDGQG